jgi:hypothetical protein
MKKLLTALLTLLSLSVFSQVQVVTLDGSKSSDPDGFISSYKWTQVGTAPSICLISNADKAQATVVPSGGAQWQPGVYTFQLTITDNLGATSSTTTTVTIVSNPPTVDAGSSQSVQLPAPSVTLKATARATLGIIKSWLWSQTSGPNVGTLSRRDTSTVTLSNLIPGTYIFKIAVIDNYGQSATDTVSLIVKAANQAPSSNAGQDQTITLPATSVAIGGKDSPDNASVIWHKKSGGAAIIFSPRRSVTKVTLLNTGKYVFVKSVTDRNGNIVVDEVAVTLKRK